MVCSSGQCACGRDGLSELLAVEAGGTTGNADYGATVGRRMMVFKVGDERRGFAHACDVRVHMPDAAVSLVVDSRRGLLRWRADWCLTCLELESRR